MLGRQAGPEEEPSVWDVGSEGAGGVKVMVNTHQISGQRGEGKSWSWTGRPVAVHVVTKSQTRLSD